MESRRERMTINLFRIIPLAVARQSLRQVRYVFFFEMFKKL